VGVNLVALIHYYIMHLPFMSANSFSAASPNSFSAGSPTVFAYLLLMSLALFCYISTLLGYL